MAETLTSRLDAVNAMLGTIGDAPINSIETGSLPAEVQTAVNILHETSRKVQTRGWNFNSESDFELSKNANGNINLPGNTLKVDLTIEDWQRNVVQRGLRLYDRQNHTYVFTSNVKVDLVMFLSWDELPESAREYIKIRAARIFQARNFGSDTLNGFTEKDEFRALVDMEAADAESEDATIFQNYDTASILGIPTQRPRR
jgi:hypothetical protein